MTHEEFMTEEILVTVERVLEEQCGRVRPEILAALSAARGEVLAIITNGNRARGHADLGGSVMGGYVAAQRRFARERE
jgi:FMN phosphatase YigB (HAD superfamily)